MALRNLVKETVTVFNGQRSSVPFGALAASDATLMLDWVVRKGRLRKIWGQSLYANPQINGGAGGIPWIDYFIHLWIFQQGTTINIETAVGSAIFKTIGNILGGDAGNIVSSEKWKNNIYFVNGVENRFYQNFVLPNQSSQVFNPFMTLGLFPPGNGLAAQPNLTVFEESSAGATLVQGVTYKYLITFWDNNTQTESLPNGAVVQADGLWLGTNPAALTIQGASDTAASVSIVNVLAAGYDVNRVSGWRLYRLAQADGTPKLVSNIHPNAQGNAFIDIAQTSWADIDGDETNLGTVMDQTLSPPPGGRQYYGTNDVNAYGPRYVKFFRDQLWLFGVRYPGDAGRLYLPTNGILYGSQVDDFDYWQFEYNIGQANDQDDTGIAEFRNTLILFKEGSTYYLDGNNPTNYVVMELDTKRGVIAPGSIQETPVGVIGLSAEGFCLFSNVSGGQIISNEINDLIDRINHAALGKITSGFDIREQKYECHVPLDADVNASMVFIFDTVQNTWSFTTRIGGAVKYDRAPNKNVIGLLGGVATSQLALVTDKSQVTNIGNAINSIWSSKNFDFAMPNKLKRLQKVVIQAQAAINFKLHIDIIPDFGQQETITICDIDPDSDYAEFDGDDVEGGEIDDDEDEFDLAEWAGDLIAVKFTIPVQCLARNIQLRIRNDDTSQNAATLEIQEIILEANLIGGEGSK